MVGVKQRNACWGTFQRSEIFTSSVSIRNFFNVLHYK